MNQDKFSSIFKFDDAMIHWVQILLEKEKQTRFCTLDVMISNDYYHHAEIKPNNKSYIKWKTYQNILLIKTYSVLFDNSCLNIFLSV